MFIYIDESGDLGFDYSKNKTSKYFVITFLFTQDKRVIDKVVKLIFKEFKKKHLKRHPGTLHCYKESPSTRKKLLKRLVEKNITIMTVYLNKEKVYTDMPAEKHILYNFVTNILLDRALSKYQNKHKDQIEIIASKRETNTFLNDNFELYLKNQAKQNHDVDIKIETKYPSQEKGLQAVDFVCWAIFRKWEHGDTIYYDIIKPRIKEENPLFP
jgi:undecaprenyl pyrophosphate synthase